MFNMMFSLLTFSIYLLISDTLAQHRDERKVQFEFDGQTYKFNFVQSDRNVYDRYNPVWLAKSVPGGNPNYTYEIVKNSDRFINGHFYIDNDKKAVVYAHYDDIGKKILYDGTFGDGNESHYIKSLEHNSKLRSLSGDYLITKINENNNPVHLHSEVTTRMNSQLWKENLENPLNTFYPKVLAVVDYHLFRELGKDVAATVQYVATFWNAVDRKFIELDSPKVQFVLTGIIVAEDETALNYVYQSRFTPEDAGENDRDRADADAMNEYLRLYFHHNFSSDIKDFENYDVAVVLTGLDTFPVGGVTHNAKICDDWYNVAVVADDGQFGGIRSAAHEMAHLLHSSIENRALHLINSLAGQRPFFMPSFKRMQCVIWSKSYFRLDMSVQHDSLSKDDKCYALPADGSVSIMSPIQKESNRVYWSECSKKYFNDFSKVKAAQCLETRQRTRYYPKEEM